MGTRTGAKAEGYGPEPGPKASFLSAHPEEEGRMPGCPLEKMGEWEKEGSHNRSIDHKSKDFHKSDSQMGAACPTTVLTASQLKFTPPGWLWARATETGP